MIPAHKREVSIALWLIFNRQRMLRTTCLQRPHQLLHQRGLVRGGDEIVHGRTKIEIRVG
jgi:hypothetical protein